VHRKIQEFSNLFKKQKGRTSAIGNCYLPTARKADITDKSPEARLNISYFQTI
jgi:hypothetical protein